MLLIFFLVTSSMDSDWGLPRQLPNPENLTEEQEVVVKKRNALCLKLDAQGQLTCNDEPRVLYFKSDNMGYHAIVIQFKVIISFINN